MTLSNFFLPPKAAAASLNDVTDWEGPQIWDIPDRALESAVSIKNKLQSKKQPDFFGSYPRAVEESDPPFFCATKRSQRVSELGEISNFRKSFF